MYICTDIDTIIRLIQLWKATDMQVTLDLSTLKKYQNRLKLGQNLKGVYQNIYSFFILEQGTPKHFLSTCKLKTISQSTFFDLAVLKRDYIQNGTHHSGMWGCQEGLNPKFQSLCSKNEAAQAPTPPQNDEFSIK